MPPKKAKFSQLKMRVRKNTEILPALFKGNVKLMNFEVFYLKDEV